MTRRSVWLGAMAWLLWTSGAGAPAAAADLDFSAWQRLPVFDGGRMMPLDTFARTAASKICGREAPRLALGQALPGVDVQSAEYAAARQIFPDGEPRKFEPGELLFSWLVEPVRWERVPFLAAKHHDLREQILGLPRADEEGRPLEYVSPYQFEQSEGLRKWREEIGRKMAEAEAQEKQFEFEGLDKKAAELVEAYNRWRQLTFSPDSLADGSTRFVMKLGRANRTWASVRDAMREFRDLDRARGPGDWIDAVNGSLDELVKTARGARMPLDKVEPLVARLRSASDALARWFDDHNARVAKTPPGKDAGQHKEALAYYNALASRTRDLSREAADAQSALFDNGGTLKLVPNLNPFALEENRTPEDNPQPWLSLQALLLGSPETLDGYPTGAVEEVRQSFRQAAAAWLARGRDDRPGQFAAAMDRFALAVRELGEKTNAIRAKLPVKKLDETALAATQFPAPGATAAEVHYNQFQPFLWSWITTLLAVALFSLSFGAMRKPMFWSAVAMLGAGLLLIAYGLGLRTVITGWAPVTNMFETVVFVALVVAGLGIWFTLVPLVWPGLKSAWRLTAAPLTWEISSGADEDDPVVTPKLQSASSWLLVAPRVALMCGVFVMLTQVPYGEGQGYTVVSLSPRVEAAGALTANDLVTWAVGLCMLVLAAWYVPRAALTVLLGVATVPYALSKTGLQKPLDQVLARKAYAFSGAAVGLLASIVAYYAPVFENGKAIAPLRPVLRDNFWLTIHVLTITASYGAGALALGLGNVALFHYLFGRYRDPAPPSAEAVARGHRPAGGILMPKEIHRREPAASATLAAFTYKATQVAVLLLAAGTILGALWADVAWGRFWGWDAKEVWALISLLVYLVILHGRYAGLFGNFGLAAFSVAGATSIMMAWYGVNFVLDTGLHSYGRGTGGLWAVLTFVGLDWLFMIAAAVRYNLEVRVESPHGSPPPGYTASGNGDLARLKEEVAAR